MKFLFFILIFIFQLQNSATYAQKPVIDSAVYDKWPAVRWDYISNDGKYIWYNINKQPFGGSTYVVRSYDGSWERRSTEHSFGLTAYGRKAIFKKSKDSLAILTLGTDSTEIIPRVKSYNVLSNNLENWLLYYLLDSGNELFIRNLRTGQTNSITSVADYFFGFNGQGSVLIVKKVSNNGCEVTQSLDWFDLMKGKRLSIWSGTGMAGEVFFDKEQNRMAFLSEIRVEGQIQLSIWYYKVGMSKANKLFDNGLGGKDIQSQELYIDHFSEDGSRLFIKYKKKIEKRNIDDGGAVQVDVWSYTDAKLQSQQLYELKNSSSKIYSAVIVVDNHKVFPLDQTGEEVMESNDHFILLNRNERAADVGEDNWNVACKFSVFLVSTKDGTRRLIKENTNLFFRLSPEGKYVINYDPKQKNYFSFATETGLIKNITKEIQVSWEEYENEQPDASSAVNALTGWLKGDIAVLLHDQNDIWIVDPSGNKPPQNLTNGYGKKHNVVFCLAKDEGSAILNSDEKILLSAFNRSTKENGFYSKVLHQKGNPNQLTMGPYVYDVPNNNPRIDGRAPLKARDAEAYIVKRMSATESPNYFYTHDFKNLVQVSDVHPERVCNWLKSELLSWKTMNGSTTQGILYKPENFDPKKKYPVIFCYYERLSDELNEFRNPDYAGDRLDIPTYVSNGYIVFTPDIHYKIGGACEGALNSLLSAARYLSKMPFVDSMKMGLQGHSFGGYQTNCVITHSHFFAAACSASGLSDCVSEYGALAKNGYSLQSYIENSQGRIGATLWGRPDLYIKNSPVFRADKITTPLLIMHTKKDGIYPFANTMELFTALRRLGKKVWMLQYDDGEHSLDGKSAVDFTIRMQQFFDHYLKGAPAPKWMVEGIPAARKGIDDGLELEPPGVVPGPGLLTPDEQKKVDALKHRKPITVTFN